MKRLLAQSIVPLVALSPVALAVSAPVTVSAAVSAAAPAAAPAAVTAVTTPVAGTQAALNVPFRCVFWYLPYFCYI